MWLPTPIYERIPQFYFLVGLLFVANALYIGFEFTVSFYYIAFGLASCFYGIGIFVMRMNARKQEPAASGAPAVSAAPAPMAAEAPAEEDEDQSFEAAAAAE